MIEYFVFRRQAYTGEVRWRRPVLEDFRPETRPGFQWVDLTGFDVDVKRDDVQDWLRDEYQLRDGGTAVILKRLIAHGALGDMLFIGFADVKMAISFKLRWL